VKKFMSHNLEQRERRRQPDWSKASLIHLESADDKHSSASRQQTITEAQWQHFYDTVSVSKTKEQLVKYKEILLTPRKEHKSLGDYLETELSQAHIQSLALTLDAPLEGAIRGFDRPYVLTTSSTHRSTAQLFDALDRVSDFDTGQRGIISFDHHSDLEGVNQKLNPGDLPSKANVMAYVLKKRHVEAVAVFGTSDFYSIASGKNYDVIPSGQLYEHGLPQRQLFIEQLRRTLQSWKETGIRQVYTSVDLDGLRLPEQLYSATDYNPIDQLRYKLLHSSDNVSHEPYQGIPAAWIPLAMQIARREFGMVLGLKKHRSEQRIIGDVVEYVGPDYAGRTARIAKAILGSMLAEAQVK